MNNSESGSASWKPSNYGSGSIKPNNHGSDRIWIWNTVYKIYRRPGQPRAANSGLQNWDSSARTAHNGTFFKYRLGRSSIHFTSLLNSHPTIN